MTIIKKTRHHYIGEGNFCALLEALYVDTATMENSVMIPQKINNTIPV